MSSRKMEIGTDVCLLCAITLNDIYVNIGPAPPPPPWKGEPRTGRFGCKFKCFIINSVFVVKFKHAGALKLT